MQNITSNERRLDTTASERVKVASRVSTMMSGLDFSDNDMKDTFNSAWRKAEFPTYYTTLIDPDDAADNDNRKRAIVQYLRMLDPAVCKNYDSVWWQTNTELSTNTDQIREQELQKIWGDIQSKVQDAKLFAVIKKVFTTDIAEFSEIWLNDVIENTAVLSCPGCQ